MTLTLIRVFLLSPMLWRGSIPLVEKTSFRELFLDYNMDRTFGLILLHRHFDLNENERLVEYNGTSVPWRLSNISGNIRASSYLHPRPCLSVHALNLEILADCTRSLLQQPCSDRTKVHNLDIPHH